MLKMRVTKVSGSNDPYLRRVKLEVGPLGKGSICAPPECQHQLYVRDKVKKWLTGLLHYWEKERKYP